jgi:hypothetical protein
MRGLFLIHAFLLLFISFSFTQNCDFYYPTRSDTRLELKQFDAKGNLKNTVKERVVNSLATQDGYVVTVHRIVNDKLDSLILEDNIDIKCKGDGFILYMGCYFHDLELEKYLGNEIRVEADSIIIPKNVQPGLLPSFVTARISVLEEGLPVKHMVVNVYFRIVEGFEEVTTPAGTFQCLKMNYEVETIVNQKVKSKGIEWFSKEAGLVKRETYDRFGKLMEKTILTSIEYLDQD